MAKIRGQNNDRSTNMHGLINIYEKFFEIFKKYENQSIVLKILIAQFKFFDP